MDAVVVWDFPGFFFGRHGIGLSDLGQIETVQLVVADSQDFVLSFVQKHSDRSVFTLEPVSSSCMSARGIQTCTHVRMGHLVIVNLH